MDLALVTIAYNNYGPFLVDWCDRVAKMDPRPTQTVVALGRNHGLTSEQRARCLELLPELKIVRSKHFRMGPLRNVAVRASSTEWVMYLSVDDGIYPDAISKLEKHVEGSDYICISWSSLNTWDEDSQPLYHRGRHPKDMARLRKGRGFVIGHSPYRRELFDKVGGYRPHDLPNAPFVAAVVAAGARFAAEEEPVTIYLKRRDSHASLLGRRGAAYMNLPLKKRANRYKAEQEAAIRRRKWE